MIATPEKIKKIKTMGIITGGAGNHYKEALTYKLDAYLTGEISEHNWHECREDGLFLFAAGHNATEETGVIALIKLLEKKFNLECDFLKSNNPA